MFWLITFEPYEIEKYFKKLNGVKLSEEFKSWVQFAKITNRNPKKPKIEKLNFGHISLNIRDNSKSSGSAPPFVGMTKLFCKNNFSVEHT